MSNDRAAKCHSLFQENQNKQKTARVPLTLLTVARRRRKDNSYLTWTYGRTRWVMYTIQSIKMSTVNMIEKNVILNPDKKNKEKQEMMMIITN